MQYYVGDEPLLISEEWFSWIVVIASGWLIIFTYAFCFRLHHIKFLRLEQFLVITMTILTFVTMPILRLTADLGQILSFANIVIFAQLILFTGMMAVASWQSKSKEGMWLTIAHLLNVPLGLHDMLLQNYQINLESYYLLPYTIFAPMFILMLIVRERYAHAMIEIENANKLLEFKLQERETALRQAYEEKNITEQKQLLSQERVRLMKDMHDGFGSTLTTTMVLLKAGKIDTVQAGDYLEECINDLRLVIDSIEPTGNTFESVLINYSHRLHEKFAQMGIKCQRELDAIPLTSCLSPSDTLHILRILQEVFVNILKHAKATTVVWSCKIIDENIIFKIKDNGCGFDIAEVKKNRGIVNIQSRARLLQAIVKWESKKVGTTFTMLVPIGGR